MGNRGSFSTIHPASDVRQCRVFSAGKNFLTHTPTGRKRTVVRLHIYELNSRVGLLVLYVELVKSRLPLYFLSESFTYYLVK